MPDVSSVARQLSKEWIAAGRMRVWPDSPPAQDSDVEFWQEVQRRLDTSGAKLAEADFVPGEHPRGRGGRWIKKLYHVAPVEARASIDTYGADATRAAERWSEGEQGFYAFGDPGEARWYAELMAGEEPAGPMDVYEVKATADKLSPDAGLTGSGEPTSSVRVAEPVPARRVATYTPGAGWEGERLPVLTAPPEPVDVAPPEPAQGEVKVGGRAYWFNEMSLESRPVTVLREDKRRGAFVVKTDDGQVYTALKGMVSARPVDLGLGEAAGRAVREIMRLPNGEFAPRGMGQVLTAGERVAVPHRTRKGRMVPGRAVQGPKGKVGVILDEGPDKGKPFEVSTQGQEALPAGMRAATPDEAKELGLPPSNTPYVPEGGTQPNGLVAVSVDQKGRVQRLYTREAAAERAAKKFERVRRLAPRLPAAVRRMEQDAEKDDTALAALLIAQTGMRPGSRRDRGGEKVAYGASTLRAGQVSVDGDTTRLQFVGKGGKELDLSVRDARLAQLLTDRLEGKKPDEPLFDTSDRALSSYVSDALGGEFKTKDLRTVRATAIAASLVQKAKVPESAAAAKRARRAIATKVSAALGNTPDMALKSYIDPMVWKPWPSV